MRRLFCKSHAPSSPLIQNAETGHFGPTVSTFNPERSLLSISPPVLNGSKEGPDHPPSALVPVLAAASSLPHASSIRLFSVCCPPMRS